MEILKGNWSFKMIVSDKTDKMSVCNCVFFKVVNYSDGVIYIGLGGNEIEVYPNEADFLINGCAAVTAELKFRYSPGNIKVKITKTELA